MFGSDFTRVDENDELHQHIKKRFFLDLEGFGLQTQVVSIHRNSRSSSFWQGKLKAFVKTYENIGNGGNANLRQAWFSASKAQIVSILSRGCFSEAITNGVYGPCVSLSPLTIDGVNYSVPDEDGLRYMVCCCVNMGQIEILGPVSKQNCSSSNKYHSGVDDLVYPTKYLIWDGYTDSHIFPVFVISFKSCTDVFSPVANNTQKERLANCLQPETWEKILERFDLYLQAPPICNGLPSTSTTPSSTRVTTDDVQKSPADEPRGSPNDEQMPKCGLADPGREWFERYFAYFKDLERRQQQL